MSTLPTRLKIRYYGDPALRQRARPVVCVTEKECLIWEKMADLMRLAGGVGLAATQVGVNKEMLVVDVGEGPVFLANPRLTKKRGSDVKEEGCLSLPGITIEIRRAKRIEVSGLNERNEKILFSAHDLLARALQHEMDHLRGRLIIDYAGLMERVRIRKRIKALARRDADGKESF